MFVEIKNWKEVVGQFGLNETTQGIGAKGISKTLADKSKLHWKNENLFLDNINVSYSKTHESIALFVLVESIKEKNTVVYEYIGTAN